ncbi:hypothetical protein [Mycolicibacterium brumae]|uniref:ATP/GTP-binding protein n=1 Tax=Mycolicibacterium brumae TaxID=85968 RepID=A0A2G5P967_9MYCO|nr:hypothetical protein [Mycolicibacterium brumae]MCV7193936.1 hypothetical protein [Mycolicibacterium brumae]PIB74892.1 hypothetical protein CQY22_010990 [Mycolicibacterium brumae]RWA22489.1 hypothetical protein MBRU_12975 [Mycolicibacterium brumae DSM 44177]UWW07984.1 hypothetical protein L2Z93_001023 [Mycolicibacterium brumae]
MPRRARRRAGGTARRPGPRSSPRTEIGADGRDYQVRVVAGSGAVKTYRCPGCDHEIRPGVAHVVVWPSDGGDAGVEDRRHWHTPCWQNRATRSPTRRWS